MVSLLPAAHLLRGACVFGVCAMPSLASSLRKTLQQSHNHPYLLSPLNAIVRRTAFPLFCAGTDFNDCIRVAEMYGAAGIKLIIDHSTEEELNPEGWVRNAAQKSSLFKLIKSSLHSQAPFVPLKITALCSPEVLEAISRHITSRPEWTSNWTENNGWIPQPLQLDFESLVTRVTELGVEARESGIGLLLDAEQNHLQPAVDALAIRVMQNVNTNAQLTVYNTYQMYLKTGSARLARDLDYAQANHFGFGVKLVRGAYMMSETERAKALTSDVPMHDVKSKTDASYNASLSLLLNRIAAEPKHSVAAIVATHNRNSIEVAKRIMTDLGMQRNHPGVQFAQIMGMCDNITAQLGVEGYNALKLVLFGDYERIMPWLLRRIDENQDMLNATAAERSFVWQELWRRARGNS